MKCDFALDEPVQFVKEAAMYSNQVQSRRIRNRVLMLGESIRSVAKREGMSRNTLRKSSS